MYYRSPQLTAALATAQTLAPFPKIPLAIIGDPGPERLDVALAAFPPDVEPSILSCSALCKGAIKKSLWRLLHEAQGHFDTPHAPIILDDADCLSNYAQTQLLKQTFQFVITTDPHNFKKLNPRLRLHVANHTLTIPPLSERPEDVAPIALGLLSTLTPDGTPSAISQDAWDIILATEWPSSRMLLHRVQDAIYSAQLERADQISIRHLPPELLATSPYGWLDIPISRRWTKKRLEETFILHAVSRAPSRAVAARAIGMSTRALYSRISAMVGGQPRERMVGGELVKLPPHPPAKNASEEWERAGTEFQLRADRGTPRPFGGKVPPQAFEETRRIIAQLHEEYITDRDQARHDRAEERKARTRRKLPKIQKHPTPRHKWDKRRQERNPLSPYPSPSRTDP